MRNLASLSAVMTSRAASLNTSLAPVPAQSARTGSGRAVGREIWAVGQLISWSVGHLAGAELACTVGLGGWAHITTTSISAATTTTPPPKATRPRTGGIGVHPLDQRALYRLERRCHLPRGVLRNRRHDLECRLEPRGEEHHPGPPVVPATLRGQQRAEQRRVHLARELAWIPAAVADAVAVAVVRPQQPLVSQGPHGTGGRGPDSLSCSLPFFCFCLHPRARPALAAKATTRDACRMQEPPPGIAARRPWLGGRGTRRRPCAGRHTAQHQARERCACACGGRRR